MIVRLQGDHTRRRGIASLIEVLVSITLTAVLFGTTATLTALMFRMERIGRDDLSGTITIGRLATDFRSDVHASSHVEIEDDPETCSLRGSDDRAVTYCVQNHHLLREERAEDQTLRIERYRFAYGTVIRWEAEETADRPRVALLLDSPPAPGAIGGHETRIRIEATLGRDGRFLGDRP